MTLVMTGEIKRTESSEETESTTTASRRDSEDSDSGVNLSEREREPGENIIEYRVYKWTPSPGNNVRVVLRLLTFPCVMWGNAASLILNETNSREPQRQSGL